MQKKFLFPIVIFVAVVFLSSCDYTKRSVIFEKIPSYKSGVTFNNKITESDSFNVLSFEYIYDGGGVGVGDVNNDGLTDIFFSGNMVSSKLYLNKGNFKFQDVTDSGHISTSSWCTGVAMVDINHDGWLDIYVSAVQPIKGGHAVPNLLFLNRGLNSSGIPEFEEIAGRVGLADSSYTTQAAFFDYDLDGDLDVYLVNNALEDYNRNIPVGQRRNGEGRSVDKLYRNEGIQKNGLPFFVDVSYEAGILSEGWGLGITVNDLNRDGNPDIYVANDFLSNDLLYINNGDGTFSNKIACMLKHQEQNGMGMDIADINNDGLSDIVVMDMMPDDNKRQKGMFTTTGYDGFWLKRRKGYQDQYVRNVLQINNGNNTFSDIGYMSGIYATDWSWSVLLADFDNDGLRDMFITNGYVKDVTDLDFVTYRKEALLFGSDESRMRELLKGIDKLIGVKKSNFLYRNNGDFTFTDVSESWGLSIPSFSNGSAYADLDNDGDLDLVTNNIGDDAFIFRNKSRECKTDANYLRIKLAGPENNISGLGAKIWIYCQGNLQFAEHTTQRGYKSNVENTIHFGLGKVKMVDSAKILWPGGRAQILKSIASNQTLLVKESDAENIQDKKKRENQSLLYKNNTERNIAFKHEEDDFDDFKHGQAIIPHKFSQMGPGIAVGDINNDNLEDFVVGGSAGKPATLFFQQSDGTFQTDLLPAKEEEDMGILLFDADNDGDLDLYCVSGSSEFDLDSTKYQDRLYRNYGNGNFLLEREALPDIHSSGSCVIASDFDKDGDQDLFVGGRITPTRYPEAPRSYLLQNDGSGVFIDITQSVCPNLSDMGLVTASLWTDFDNDGWIDLIVTGEWMPVIFFKNIRGSNFRQTELSGSRGWWNSIYGGDFDNDGDIDYIAGNLGLNSVYKASPSQPVTVYYKDFDRNGIVDPIICRYTQNVEYPVHPRETLFEQIGGLRRRILTYAQYGTSRLPDIFPDEKFETTPKLKAVNFASSFIKNNGNGNFEIIPLPARAQFSPVYGTVVLDINEDGNLDVVTVGNSYSPEPLSGFMDAGIGCVLLGDGKGNFMSMIEEQSGLFVPGDAKALASLTLGDNSTLFIISQNQDSLLTFQRIDKSGTAVGSIVRPEPWDEYAIIKLKNGKTRKQELYRGSGYLSSSSRFLRIDENQISIDLQK